jgi:hypothetical protein
MGATATRNKRRQTSPRWWSNAGNGWWLGRRRVPAGGGDVPVENGVPEGVRDNREVPDDDEEGLLGAGEVPNDVSKSMAEADVSNLYTA